MQGAGLKLTRESEVGEKSLLWTESRCPTKRCTFRPDCRKGVSCRGGGAWVLPNLTKGLRFPRPCYSKRKGNASWNLRPRKF